MYERNTLINLTFNKIPSWPGKTTCKMWQLPLSLIYNELFQINKKKSKNPKEKWRQGREERKKICEEEVHRRNISCYQLQRVTQEHSQFKKCKSDTESPLSPIKQQKEKVLQFLYWWESVKEKFFCILEGSISWWKLFKRYLGNVAKEVEVSPVFCKFILNLFTFTKDL